MTKKYFSFLLLVVMTGSLLAGCKKDVEVTPIDSSDVDPYQNESQNENQPEADQNDAEASLSDGVWTLNSEKSTLTYTASKIVGNSHTGTVVVKSGQMTVEAGAVKSGEFVMDMTTITESENNAMYLTHVRGEDFFAVDTHPEARLVVKNVEKLEGDKYQVTGDLTIRDKTNEITFEAVASNSENGLNVTADFTIDRTKWDIKFNSSSFVQNLGDNAIKDEIEFKLDLMFESAK